MKTIIVFALFVACVAAAPRKHKQKHIVESAIVPRRELVEPAVVRRRDPIEAEPEPAHILRYENDNIGVGPYNYV